MASMAAALSGPLPEPQAQAALALLQREESGLRSVIGRYVRDLTTVDDIFQEVSLKVLRRIDTVRDPATMRGWLFQLARNACLDWLRKEMVRSGEGEGVLKGVQPRGEQASGPADRLLSAERIAAVRRALEELPASQREVIRLRLQEGLDHEAIARRLGLGRNAIEVRFCRGRNRLKERLDEIMEGEA